MKDLTMSGVLDSFRFDACTKRHEVADVLIADGHALRTRAVKTPDAQDPEQHLQL